MYGARPAPGWHALGAADRQPGDRPAGASGRAELAGRGGFLSLPRRCPILPALSARPGGGCCAGQERGTCGLDVDLLTSPIPICPACTTTRPGCGAACFTCSVACRNTASSALRRHRLRVAEGWTGAPRLTPVPLQKLFQSRELPISSANTSKARFTSWLPLAMARWAPR